MSKRQIIIGEDDRAVRTALSKFLRSTDYEVTEAETCAEVKEAFRQSQPDAAILDYSLPDGNAMDLLPYLKKLYPSVPLILLTGSGTIQLAVKAIKEGAEQFLTKPVEMSAIALVLERSIKNQRNHRKQLAGEALQQRDVANPFLGSSKIILEVEEEARKLTASNWPILIAGETGSGKGVLAKWFHDQSPRADEPFVNLNCACFGRELLETELFGHEAGAFTGAVQRKIGLFEIAQRGTVFLDEIGDMDLQIQPKLLKILEEKKFRRLGDTQERQLDVRLIAASHEDLNHLVQQKRFRSDLYFRVNTFLIHMPPLRKRTEDIPALAQMLLDRASSEISRPHLAFSDESLQRLSSYGWPGNIRELRNVIERAALLATDEIIRPKDLRLELQEDAPTSGNEPVITFREMQKLHIQRALTAEHSNVGRAAARLGLTKSTLYNKIKTFRIDHSARQSS
ncbi:MAG TPA: sigma-54 dependent transcriptional regulator [Terriglobales bacterium]|jgi:DNA-binding NtrC family response regulator|nr:sigma-54 dependent transcriptional regulator [Terriglobales bacterium]